ncbi:uncharacterized protein [Lolium perenne]|uniref:uncharacterized protein n=1 Tax=Lolium perenne TaxID=4522 RepID=UPI003A99B8C4
MARFDSSSGSGSSNPFAGPSVAVIRDIPIADRVPLKLSTTAANFFPWKTYFGLLFREYDLLDHVDGTIDLLAMPHDPEWLAIDATIIRWFYQTVSNDIFRTVVRDGDSAHTVWDKITGLFTDNKIQRVTFLQQEFFGTHQNDLSLDDYALKLKSLSDELRDLEFPIDDKIMLSTLSAGLGEDLSNAASNLTLLTTPTFEQAVAYLRLEERRLKHLRARAAHTAFAAGFSRGAQTPAPRAPAPRPGVRRRASPPPPRRPVRPVTRPAGPAWTGHAGARPAGRPPGPASRLLLVVAAVAVVDVAVATEAPMPPPPRLVPRSTPPLRHGLPVITRGPGLFTPTPCPCRAPPTRALWGRVQPPTRRSTRRPSLPRPTPPLRDGRTRMLLHRCDSPGDLYPVGAASTTTGRPLALSAGVDLWHARLGHPSSATLRQIMQGFSFTYVATTLTAFFAFVSTQFGRSIHAFQTDNGKEFDNITIRSLLATHGTIFRLTCPYTSSQNGRAERMLRTLNDCVRTLLFHASMPPRFWPDALATATLLVNIRPCRTHGDTSDDAPGARWPSCGRAPTTDRGGPPGAGPAWSSASPAPLALLRPRADADRGGPRLVPRRPHRPRRPVTCVAGAPRPRRPVASGALASGGRRRGAPSPAAPSPRGAPSLRRFAAGGPVRGAFARGASPAAPRRCGALARGALVRAAASSSSRLATRRLRFPSPCSPAPRRRTAAVYTLPADRILPHDGGAPSTSRPGQAPGQTGPSTGQSGHQAGQTGSPAGSATAPSPVPTSARAALRDPHWRAAMQEEYDALQRNRTWELVPRPPRANVITGKWVFKHKLGSDGTLERYKARWVVRGFRQRAGVDFTDTNGCLARQPTGFVDPERPDDVCLLSRSLYGLKQAPRAWYQRIAGFLHQLGFRSTRSDASLFVYRTGNDMAYLLLYVDDIILTASTAALLRQLTDRLRAEFALKDLGPLHYFLGIEVVRRADGFFLHQRKYAHELLERAGMLNCNPAPTPVDTKAKLSASDGSPASDAPFYRSIVGALQYLTLTRPELQYAVQQVCLHMHAPRDVHWAAVKRILRYVCGSKESTEIRSHCLSNTTASCVARTIGLVALANYEMVVLMAT